MESNFETPVSTSSLSRSTRTGRCVVELENSDAIGTGITAAVGEVAGQRAACGAPHCSST